VVNRKGYENFRIQLLSCIIYCKIGKVAVMQFISVYSEISSLIMRTYKVQTANLTISRSCTKLHTKSWRRVPWEKRWRYWR